MKGRKLKTQRANYTQQTHQNTGKEQLSLDMGSAEYQEYCDDLQEVDPYKPDDEWHEKLEEHNENHDDVLSDKAEKAQNQELGADKQSYRKRMYKESMFTAVKSAAITEAISTDSTVDDVAASRMNQADNILENLQYDNGISEDDYLPKALTKYL